MNKTIKVINNRISLRKFSDIDVTKEDLDIIINSSLRAPTAGNLMLYSMIVVKNKETLKKLSISCDNQPFISSASFAIIFVADYQRIYDYYIKSGVKDILKQNNEELINPDLSDLLLASEDALVAAQSSVIAAESIGVGSCYIGDIIENYEYHKELLNLPNYVFPLSMLVYGYYPENINIKLRPRFDKKFIVFDEKYKQLSNSEFDEMYKIYEKKFNINNKFNAENYGQLLYKRKYSSSFSKEMRRSANVAFTNWKKDYEYKKS